MRKKLIIYIYIFIFLLVLVGCGGFVEEESLAIRKEVDSDGKVYIVIDYPDEELEDLRVEIPQGTDGVGIDQIYQSTSEDGNSTILQFTYTNGKSPTTISIPNGVSIKDVKYETNADGNVELKLVYTNNKESAAIIIPKGEKGEQGEQGVSIVDIIKNTDEEGNMTIQFLLSNNEKTQAVAIPNGIGITSIEESFDDKTYYLSIELTNGEIVTVDFEKPKDPNTWHTGSSIPDSSLGKDGDFYFDIDDTTIYAKTANKWVTVIQFENNETEYTVKFVKTAEDILDFKDTEFTIKNGTTFYSNNFTIPKPYRVGYTFGGWYTTQNPNPYINGMFTDLTIVNCDITLYPYWIPNAE